MPAAQSSPHRAKEKEIYIFYFFKASPLFPKDAPYRKAQKKSPAGLFFCRYFNVMLLLRTVELYKNSTSASVKSTKFPTRLGIM